ncbi:MAG: hypothetical protein WC413_02030 [Candidatus Nanoarchaeia archaeon]
MNSGNKKKMREIQPCVICDEVITNPICLDCLAREVEFWLRDRDPSLLPEVRKIRHELNVYDNFQETSETCIKCKMEMNICPHCYCTKLLKLFQTKSPELVELFRKAFISF